MIKLESWHAVEDKKKYKLVRTDDYTDIPGEIVEADEHAGTCVVSVSPGPGAPAENRALNFGPQGFKIVPRKR